MSSTTSLYWYSAAVLLHDHGDVLRRDAVGVRRDAFLRRCAFVVTDHWLIVVELVVAPP
jgi:hypothetical protein